MELLQSYLDQIPGLLETTSQTFGSMPWVAKIAAILLPVLIAAFSRHIIAIVAALILSAMTLGILAFPAFAATIVMLGAYSGALLSALAGICIRHRRSALQIELETLRASLAELSDAEQRRFLQQLKSPDKPSPNE